MELEYRKHQQIVSRRTKETQYRINWLSHNIAQRQQGGRFSAFKMRKQDAAYICIMLFIVIHFIYQLVQS